jgi:hypothetical protein
MSDDDLIRRGDAMTVADAELRRYGFGGLDGGRCDQMREAIAALPAVTAPDAPDALQAAGRHMLALHDDFLRGGDVDIAAANRLHLAASFGAQAFAVCPIPDARPAAMMRAIALALIDPMHPDLDYLRRVNMARPVEAPMMTDLMVDPESIDAFLEANPLTPKSVDDSLAADPAVKDVCEKCGGEGWLWAHELDNYYNPDNHSPMNDQTRYSCDGPKHAQPTLAEALEVPEVKALVEAANEHIAFMEGTGLTFDFLGKLRAALRQIGGEV